MTRALGHLCAHTGYIGPGEVPEDALPHVQLAWKEKVGLGLRLVGTS